MASSLFLRRRLLSSPPSILSPSILSVSRSYRVSSPPSILSPSILSPSILSVSRSYRDRTWDGSTCRSIWKKKKIPYNCLVCFTLASLESKHKYKRMRVFFTPRQLAQHYKFLAETSHEEPRHYGDYCCDICGNGFKTLWEMMYHRAFCPRQEFYMNAAFFIKKNMIDLPKLRMMEYGMLLKLHLISVSDSVRMMENGMLLKLNLISMSDSDLDDDADSDLDDDADSDLDDDADSDSDDDAALDWDDADESTGDLLNMKDLLELKKSLNSEEFQELRTTLQQQQQQEDVTASIRSLGEFQELRTTLQQQQQQEDVSASIRSLGDLLELKKSLNSEVEQLRSEFQELRTTLQQQQEDVNAPIRSLGLQDVSKQVEETEGSSVELNRENGQNLPKEKVEPKENDVGKETEQ